MESFIFKTTFLCSMVFIYGNGQNICEKLVPTPILDTATMMGGWNIVGFVGTPSWGNYVSYGSSWTESSNSSFYIWSYGEVLDEEGSTIVFDDWRTATIPDPTRPGEHVHTRDLNKEPFANATILYLDGTNMLWVDCYLELGPATAFLATKAQSIPGRFLTQMKSILEIDYGFDMAKYIEVGKLPVTSFPAPNIQSSRI